MEGFNREPRRLPGSGWGPGRGAPGRPPGRAKGLCSRGGGPGLPSSASGGGRGARGTRSRATARPGPGAPGPEEGEEEEAATGSRLILPGSAGPLAAASWGWPPGAGPRARRSCPRPPLARCARSRVVSGRRPGAPQAPPGARRGDLGEAARRKEGERA